MALTETRLALRQPRHARQLGRPASARAPRPGAVRLDHGADQRVDRRVLWLFAAGVLLVQLAWTIAFPPFWGMDETDHVFRASSVAAGAWQPATTTPELGVARGQVVMARADVVRAATGACLQHDYSMRGNCSPLGPERDGMVPIATAAGRYYPVYYAVVGTVAKPFHGQAALYAMRVTTAVWSCLFLTAALWSLLTWARSRWPVVALLLVSTPTVLYSTAVAAPNGVHLAAAICLWCSTTALLRRPDLGAATRRHWALGALVAVSGATTVLTHTLGVLWVPMILLGSWALAGRPGVHRLRTRVVLVAGSAVATAYLAAVVWVLLARTNNPMAEPLTIPHPWPWWRYVGRGAVLWPLQSVGAFPDKQDAAPTLVYGAWLVGALVLVIAAWPRLRLREHRVQKVTILLIMATSLALPSALTVMTVSRLGGAWQGRYGFPLAMGVILGLGMIIDQAPEHRERVQRALVLAAPVLFVLANAAGQVGVLTETRRLPGMVSAAAWDVPPVWSFVVLAAVGAALLTEALRRQPRMSA